MKLQEFLKKLEPHERIDGGYPKDRFEFNKNTTIRGGYGVIRHYVKVNQEILAYALNPGNGVVIVKNRLGNIHSWTCCLTFYPCATKNNKIIWIEVENEEAVKMIRKLPWLEKSSIPRGIRNREKMRDKWEHICSANIYDGYPITWFKDLPDSDKVNIIQKEDKIRTLNYTKIAGLRDHGLRCTFFDIYRMKNGKITALETNKLYVDGYIREARYNDIRNFWRLYTFCINSRGNYYVDLINAKKEKVTTNPKINELILFIVANVLPDSIVEEIYNRVKRIEVEENEKQGK